MKKVTFISARLLLLILLAFSSSCYLLDMGGDACERSERPEIEAGIIVNVKVVDADNKPIPEQDLVIILHKVPCGSAKKGEIMFAGPTDDEGSRQTTVAYYKLRNTDDGVSVHVEAVGLGNGSVADNSETAYYGYDTFTSGITKTAVITITRNS